MDEITKLSLSLFFGYTFIDLCLWIIGLDIGIFMLLFLIGATSVFIFLYSRSLFRGRERKRIVKKVLIPEVIDDEFTAFRNLFSDINLGGKQ